MSEEFVATSLFTLVGSQGDDEVTVLDEVSSGSIGSMDIEWCVAAFVSPDARGTRPLQGHSKNNLLNTLVQQHSWVDKQLGSNLVPVAEWKSKSAGILLPGLGTNTTYCQPTSEGSETWDSMPSKGKYRVTSKDVVTRMGGGYSTPRMYYGVSPFLGVGTRIPRELNQSVFNKLCILLDNPMGVHLIVLGKCSKAQDLFGSGFWGIRQFLIDYLGVIPSDLSTSLNTPLPFKFSTHEQVPDLSIITMGGYRDECDTTTACNTFQSRAIDDMLDLMWSMLYFDYKYLDTDPVEQDCYVALSWSIPGKTYNEKVPFNSPALVLLISKYNEYAVDRSNAYSLEEDITYNVIDRSFLKVYNKVNRYIEYRGPYSKCLANLTSYCRAFAVAMYRKTCSKKHVIMPSGALYPKKTEVRREIDYRFRWFCKDRSLTTYVKVFAHLWEKVLWGRLVAEESSLVSVFCFISRNHNLPLSSVLSNHSPFKSLQGTIDVESMRYMAEIDTSSYFLSILSWDVCFIPEIQFSGQGSIPDVERAITTMLNIYSDQVVYALEQDRYSVIESESFDKWNFANDLHGFKRFIESIKVRRSWEQEDGATQPRAHMSLKDMISLWVRTGDARLYEVLEIVVSMLTSLEVAMPSSISDKRNYRLRVKTRIGVAGIKRKLLEVMNQSEAGSKLGQ